MHHGEAGRAESWTANRGIILEQRVTIIDAKWHGTNATELVYKCADG